ncbi:serine/threonine-protein kinase [Streptomyces sp. NPDC001288]|uniref:serine/threonine-protein kinase n=1 Tax=unclassified Streptomyces TaxID=2593676 RepID=UPI0033200313
MSEDGERPVGERLIGGRYRLAERIGSGPTGTVWRARDEQDGRRVAVKEPRLTGEPDAGERQRAAHRLLHEARAAARVDHPAAVTILDVLLENELPWVVMELVEGPSLQEALAADGPLAPAEAARIGLAVLGALHAAHCVGIVHRDLKPSNVLLESGGDRVVLTDFGIGAGQQAQQGQQPEQAEQSEQSPQGQQSPQSRPDERGPRGLGAPDGFLAPECAAGRGAGPASDLWSLGALLRAATAPDPGPLGPLLERLLAADPEARPAAPEAAEILAEAAGTALPAWVTEPPAPAPRSPRAEPPPTDSEPRRLTPFAALGLLLAKKPERG